MDDGYIKDVEQPIEHVLEIEFEDVIFEVDEETLRHYDIDPEELMHYGVKGMKWGVINEEEPVGGFGGGVKAKVQELTAKVKNLVSDIKTYGLSKRKREEGKAADAAAEAQAKADAEAKAKAELEAKSQPKFKLASEWQEAAYNQLSRSGDANDLTQDNIDKLARELEQKEADRSKAEAEAQAKAKSEAEAKAKGDILPDQNHKQSDPGEGKGEAPKSSDASKKASKTKTESLEEQEQKEAAKSMSDSVNEKFKSDNEALFKGITKKYSIKTANDIKHILGKEYGYTPKQISTLNGKNFDELHYILVAEELKQNKFKHSDSDDDILVHWGILGMRWGVRRYQNNDGTLTAEGRARYGIKEEANTTATVGALIKKEDAMEENMVKGISTALNQTAGIIPNKKGKNVNKNITTYKSEKYSNISDEELRRRVSRMQMERSYGDLTGETKYIKSGEEKARETFQTLGAIAGLTATILGISATVSNLKEGHVGGK